MPQVRVLLCPEDNAKSVWSSRCVIALDLWGNTRIDMSASYIRSTPYSNVRQRADKLLVELYATFIWLFSWLRKPVISYWYLWIFANIVNTKSSTDFFDVCILYEPGFPIRAVAYNPNTEKPSQVTHDLQIVLLNQFLFKVAMNVFICDMIRHDYIINVNN